MYSVSTLLISGRREIFTDALCTISRRRNGRLKATGPNSISKGVLYVLTDTTSTKQGLLVLQGMWCQSVSNEKNHTSKGTCNAIDEYMCSCLLWMITRTCWILFYDLTCFRCRCLFNIFLNRSWLILDGCVYIYSWNCVTVITPLPQ